jgi:hypothetical protein
MNMRNRVSICTLIIADLPIPPGCTGTAIGPRATAARDEFLFKKKTEFVGTFDLGKRAHAQNW